MEPPWYGGTKVCSNDPGDMAKMATMSIYGKNFKKSSSSEPKGLKSWYAASGARVLPNYSNDDPGLTVTYFMARAFWPLLLLYGEKGKTMDFSETIVVYDIKVGRCS